MASLCVLPAFAEEDETDWSPFVEMDGQMFPSFIVATATWKPDADEEVDPSVIGDPYGQIGAYVSELPENTRVKLVIKENKWFAASEQSGKTTDAGEYWIYPKMNWNFEALLRARQIEPVNVVMELFVDGTSVGTRSETIKVRSLNDCPFYIVPTDEDGRPATSEEDVATEGTDLSFMFAAYVNENHPWVDQITKEALEAEIVDSFTGYQSEDPEEVFKQVFAIWNVMQRRGMKYSDITTTSGESQLVFSQHVRLFDEAVTARQANCVDGTVLLASILRKIGINAYLVLVPGHMYLAFDLDEEGETTIGLETTMMGNAKLKEFEKKKIPAELIEENKNNASFEAFAAAVDAGTEALAEKAEFFESEEPEHAQYQLISVAEARKMDILPLAWKKE
jgi:hypothetical protein